MSSEPFPRLQFLSGVVLLLAASSTADAQCPYSVTGGMPGAGRPAGRLPLAPIPVPLGPSPVLGGLGEPTEPGFGASPETSPGDDAFSYGIDAPDLSAWQLWWEYNQDAWLPLREAVSHTGARNGSHTGDENFFLGFPGSASADDEDSRGPSDATVWDEIVPALMDLARTDPDPQVTVSSLMALARIGAGSEALGEERRERAAEVQALIERNLDDANRIVAESATIALGALGSESAAPILVSILDDDERGRELCGRRRIPFRQRAFAAYGLGLTAHRSEMDVVRRFAVHHLWSALESDDSPAGDVKVACAVSLGLLLFEDGGRARSEDLEGLPPSASRRSLVTRMMELFEDERQQRQLRAHLPGAMARLVKGDGDPLKRVVAEPLVAHLTKRGGERNRDVQRGCVQALGLVGDADADELDADIRAALMKVAADGENVARRFAAIALAQVGSRPGWDRRPVLEGADGSGDSGVVDETVDPFAGTAEVRRFLLKRLSRSTSSLEPWYALAVGIYGHGMREAGRPLEPAAVAALRESLEDCGNAENVAAGSLALAIVGDRAASDLLLEKLERYGDDRVRGHNALALGILGAREAIEPLRGAMLDSVHHPEVLRQSAIALALLGDESRVRTLTEMTGECDCLVSLCGVASALGYAGDRDAVPPLLAMLSDTSRPGLVRANAATALGRVADRDEQPWSSLLSANVNYLAGPTSLAGPGSGGIADLR